jgi:WD40 repeat protein
VVRLGITSTLNITSVTSAALSPDGHTLAVGARPGGVGVVTLWDIANPATPRRLAPLPLGSVTLVTSVAFSPDSRTLAVGAHPGGVGAVTLWDVADPATPRRLGSPRASTVWNSVTSIFSSVTSVVFSPDGHTLAVGTSPGLVGTGLGFSGRAVTLWDIANPATPRRLEPTLSSATSVTAVTSLAFSPDGRTLAVGTSPVEGPGGTVVFLNIADPADSRVSTSSILRPVTSVAFSPDGRTLAVGTGRSAGTGGTTILLGVADPAGPRFLGAPLTTPDPTPAIRSVTSVAFSPDGRTLAVGTDATANPGAAGTVTLWDVIHPATPVALVALTGHTHAVYAVLFSRNGQLLATADADKVVLQTLR